MLGKLFKRLAGKSQAGPALQAAGSPAGAGSPAVQGSSGSSSHAGGIAGKVRGIDWWIFILMSLLLAIGLVMVLSASGIVAESSYGDKYYFFKRQLIFACAGGLALWGAASVPRGFIYRMQYPFIFFCLALLLVTLSPLSPSINGAHRWIRIGPVNLQPMEFVKISLALYLAYFMSSKQAMIKTFTRGIIPPFAVTGLFCFLLLLQPDFGSAVVLASLLFFMCIAGGTRFLYLFLFLAVAVVLAGALAISAPYRMRRLMAFVDPFQDAANTGYQLVQSLLAIGSGSFFGVGMGASRQKMFYLPEAHNDFIMAVLAEEMGFVGVSVVILLFVLFFWRCYRVVMGQQDLRDRYTAFALTVIMCLGVVLNLAVVMGVAPPKGVPMPLLSYGGSNLVATMLCVGLILNFSRTAQPCKESS
ncbi:MAG: putative lipid II flippase FtsW [Desulfovibrio sp.]|nr:putative lipid II flippase FtsW [Desulfovibrio sp.]MBR6467773.1 putative lipid II flippase FtsW [Desulfovibrio sp.]